MFFEIKMLSCKMLRTNETFSFKMLTRGHLMGTNNCLYLWLGNETICFPKIVLRGANQMFLPDADLWALLTFEKWKWVKVIRQISRERKNGNKEYQKNAKAGIAARWEKSFLELTKEGSSQSELGDSLFKIQYTVSFLTLQGIMKNHWRFFEKVNDD